MTDRERVVNLMLSWNGTRKGTPNHKHIVDTYNNNTSGYNVTYNDPWCATTVSAAAIESGLASIFPLECSCARMITKAKQMGIWVENDAYTPKLGDIIMYDWDDSGRGDCVGTPDHVGLVVRVYGGKITVIEGNKSQAVGIREVAVNGKYIRGFITPRYKDSEEIAPVQQLPTLRIGSTNEAVTHVQKFLASLGYQVGKIDGIYGQQTSSCVRSYQINWNNTHKDKVSVDGIWGPQMWSTVGK